MIRYWRLISIVIVAVVVISIFYIQSAVATHRYPTFSLVKQGGDEKKAENVTLHGDYERGFQYHNLEITTAGSKDDLENSYLGRLRGNNDSAYMQGLKKNYRGFMRGKNIDMDRSMFYEDKTLLAYADLEPFDELDHSFTFDIDILEKKSNDRQPFQVTQQNDQYSYVDVEDVQVRDDQVIVFTRNLARDSSKEEIHAYWFDIADENLVHDETILSDVGDNEQTGSDVFLIKNNDTRDNSHFVLFQEDHYVYDNDEQMDPRIEETVLRAFNLKTKKLEKINLPKEVEGIMDTVLFNQSKLYFANQTADTFELYSYDLENKKMQDKYMMEDSGVGDSPEDNGVVWNVDNHHIYISSVSKDVKSLADLKIADLNSGDILYEGAIRVDDLDELSEAAEFRVSWISID